MKTGKGFTIIEVMIVIVILGITTAVVAPCIPGIVKNARISQYTAEAINHRSMTKEDGVKFVKWAHAHAKDFTIDTPADVRKVYLKYKATTSYPIPTSTAEIPLIDATPTTDMSETSEAPAPEEPSRIEQIWVQDLEYGQLFKCRDIASGTVLYITVSNQQITGITIDVPGR